MRLVGLSAILGCLGVIGRLTTLICSGQQIGEDMAVDVGQAALDAVVVEG